MWNEETSMQFQWKVKSCLHMLMWTEWMTSDSKMQDVVPSEWKTWENSFNNPLFLLFHKGSQRI